MKNKILKQKDLFPRRKFTTGFTVLFAVIVSSLVLALGLGIVAITMKEVKLSGAGRDSQLAFYAADSGLECAQYSDLVESAFATSSDSAGNKEITCNASTTTPVLETPTPGDSATSTFTMCMEYDSATGACVENKPCAKVMVVRYKDGEKEKTYIDSRGYNTCEESNPRRLERGYSVRY